MVATVWHASFSVVAGVLYFFFVVPRWFELVGDIPHALGTVVRIVAGLLIGLAALPVVFTLLRARKPESGAPQLVLALQISSIVAHVLAGALIVGTAISEIWLSLDAAGQWLFGIYGAAAAVTLLAVVAFYVSFVAELPPPSPRLPKPKPKRRWRLRRKRGTDAVAPTSGDVTQHEATEGGTEAGAETAEEPVPAEDVPASEEAPGEVAEEPTTSHDTDADGGLGSGAKPPKIGGL
jgi:hypothetical protein